jgi:hypothetical protein
MNTSSISGSKDFKVSTVRSKIYMRNMKLFRRNYNGDITYDGKIVCRYYCTQRGCKAGRRCKFIHKPLGCVFHQQAKQGCSYGNTGDCPFSHDPDDVVVAPDLSECITKECQRSCMHSGSTCLLCFNENARKRRTRVRNQQIERRKAFEGASSSSQNNSEPPFITRSYFGR